MIEFHWPWLFLALPLPLLVYLFATPAMQSQDAALRVPFSDDFSRLTSHKPGFSEQRWPVWIAFLAWVLLVCASAQPYRLGDAIAKPTSGRDLMLAVDLSLSMETEDFVVKERSIDRLVATKLVAGQFIKQRAGDRIGLILFGENAYLQVPLTFDRQTVNALLQESALGLAGDSTSMGDAIGLAVKRLSDKNQQKVLILMTDGANTSGQLPPLKAAELAAENGMKIYTIGIGADSMIVRKFFSKQKINPSRDLDEKTLKEIARITGGRYFRARDTQEFARIYDILDQLEPVEQDNQFYRPQHPLFFWPLGTALLLAAGLCGYRIRKQA